MSPLSTTGAGAIARLGYPWLDPRFGIGGVEDRLLLMAGAFAEHAVEAQPDEQSDKGENDNDGQLVGPIQS